MTAPPPATPTAPAGKHAPTETRLGVCNLCEAICGLRYQVQGGRIIAIQGDEEDPLSRGHICPKAIALKDLHEDPDRLKQPMRRTTDAQGQSRWQPIGWDEAFDLVVEGLARVRERHGSNAVAVYQGNPTVHNWGNITHGPLFFGQLQTRNRFSATSVDQLPHHVVAYWLYGHQMHIPIPDVDRTGFMLILGGNPLASNGSLMTAPGIRARLKALRERGGKLVVVDPRRTETAAVADEHHFIDPGSDAAWLLAILHTLFDEELVEPGAFAPILDHVKAVRDAVAPFRPEAMAAHTGIDGATTRRLAREIAQADGAVVYGRMGLSTQMHGVVCQWAIQLINLLTGNIDREGGLLITSPALDLIKMGLMQPGHFDAWRSRVRGAPEFAGELPVSVMAEEMLTPGPGQVRALVTSCGNPVLSTPNGRQLDQALAGLDFMVSIDFYLNETTRHAHLILPPTCGVEHDHYDLAFLHLAVRNVARYSPAVVPAEPGALHDWQIFSELARRYARRVWALERGGFVQRLAGLATRSVMGRLSPQHLLAIGLRQTGRGLSLSQLKAHPHGLDLGPLQPSLLAKLQRAGRRIDLMPAAIRQELPQLAHAFAASNSHAPDTDPGLDAHAPSPLKLIGRRHVRSNNSWMHNSERLVSGKPRCTLWMHPDDANARGLRDGQAVAVQSRVGEVQVSLHVTEDIRPGVVSLPHGWGHDRPGARLSVARAHAGASINDLTDDRHTERISGNAAFSAVPVSVQAAAA